MEDPTVLISPEAAFTQSVTHTRRTLQSFTRIRQGKARQKVCVGIRLTICPSSQFGTFFSTQLRLPINQLTIPPLQCTEANSFGIKFTLKILKIHSQIHFFPIQSHSWLSAAKVTLLSLPTVPNVPINPISSAIVNRIGHSPPFHISWRLWPPQLVPLSFRRRTARPPHLMPIHPPQPSTASPWCRFPPVSGQCQNGPHTAGVAQFSSGTGCLDASGASRRNDGSSPISTGKAQMCARSAKPKAAGAWHKN